MFQKRRLKKERSKYRIRTLFILLFFLLSLILVVEYLSLNFSFGRTSFVSPIAKIKQSKVTFLENTLEKQKIAFFSVNLNSDSSFTVVLKEGGEVIFSSKKDLDNQLSSLQLILSRLTIEGKKLKKLDFRFDNPVVSL